MLWKQKVKTLRFTDDPHTERYRKNGKIDKHCRIEIFLLAQYRNIILQHCQADQKHQNADSDLPYCSGKEYI